MHVIYYRLLFMIQLQYLIFIAISNASRPLPLSLRRLIKQGRPAGSIFTDPGMPSSHALVATFMASAWASQLGPGRAAALLASAAVVSVLRVLCGHHSWAQILVGAAMGLGMSRAWMRLATDGGELWRWRTLSSDRHRQGRIGEHGQKHGK